MALNPGEWRWSISHQINTSFRTAGALGIAGGVVAVVGTYWISWFSLSSYPSDASGSNSYPIYRYGGITLNHLRSFVAGNGGWYAYASFVITLGALLLVGSGIVMASVNTSKSWSIRCAAGMAIGSLITLGAALGTGLPHWFTQETLIFSRGPAEWFCVAGGVLGLSALVVAARSISRMGGTRSNEIDEKTPLARVG